jgi:hypothetical protein
MKKISIAVVVTLALLLTSISCSFIAGTPDPPLTLTIPPGMDLDHAVVVMSASVGLELTLELNALSFKPGENVTVTVGEWNSLTQRNYAYYANKWPLAGLAVGPYGTRDYPMGMAFFTGNYTTDNISTAAPLWFYDPKATYHGGSMLSYITSYLFKPSGNLADVYGSCDPNPCYEDFKVSSSVTIKGYWTGGEDSKFIVFPPGVYTVAAGDEWGTLVLIHFTVEGE